MVRLGRKGKNSKMGNGSNKGKVSKMGNGSDRGISRYTVIEVRLVRWVMVVTLVRCCS